MSEDENTEHGEPCFCGLFSDLYKDIHGIRPRGDWTCAQVTEWHDLYYVLEGGRYEWRHGGPR